MLTAKDALGVEIQVGDTVTVVHYGYSARLMDTGRRVTVTGFTRAGNVTHDDPKVANGRALRPGCLAVARRDGEPGHEGNVVEGAERTSA